MSKDKISIQIIGNDHTLLTQLSNRYSSLINQDVTAKLINITNPSLTFDKEGYPHILIFLLDNSNLSTLDYLTSIPTHQRPALVIIASSQDNNLMRRSMQAGARDFFSISTEADEIKQCLFQLISEYKHKIGGKNGNLTTVINAKGGSGASLIACNIAHITAVTSSASTVLMDMDLQFGTQSLLLDVKPQHTVIEALNNIKQLDFSAIEGYQTRHNSGLRLLSTLHEQIVLPGEVNVDDMTDLLNLSLANYDNVFIDLPRLIDPLSACILDKSNHIVIVVQQTLAHMRDAKRLVKILKSELNIAEKSIIIVVNRFNGDSSIPAKDIQATLECSNLVKIPNDYEKVATATNLGIPLLDYAKNTPITNALIQLVEHLGIEINDSYKTKSFFNKLFKK